MEDEQLAQDEEQLQKVKFKEHYAAAGSFATADSFESTDEDESANSPAEEDSTQSSGRGTGAENGADSPSLLSEEDQVQRQVEELKAIQGKILSDPGVQGWKEDPMVVTVKSENVVRRPLWDSPGEDTAAGARRTLSGEAEASGADSGLALLGADLEILRMGGRAFLENPEAADDLDAPPQARKCVRGRRSLKVR